jgi:hypothetical protein
MTLQSSGLITLADVNAELLRTTGSALSLDDADIRLLTLKSSGAISMNDLYGKTYVFAATISTNQQQINLATLALAAGWNGIFPVVFTINAGVTIWSATTSVAALTTGSFPRGLTIINNGWIMGMGGNGGYAAAGLNVGPPTVGGPAISLGATTTINMAGTTSYIGGGGGGGGGMLNSGSEINGGGGGGAGGGSGGQAYQGRGGFNLGTPGTGVIGIASTEINSYGYSGTFNSPNCGPATGAVGGSAGGGGGGYSSDGISSTRDGGGSGAGGGRWFPGVGGAGGLGCSGNGGAGGSAGNAGSNGTFSGGRTDWYGAGGGGGWGAAGGSSFNGASTNAGAAGGKAVALNGYTCTLTGATTRVYGAVS